MFEDHHRSAQIGGVDRPSPETKRKVTLNLPRAMDRGAAWVYVMFPDLLQWMSIMALIFGGCCSNVSSMATSTSRKWVQDAEIPMLIRQVFALESIVKYI